VASAQLRLSDKELRGMRLAQLPLRLSLPPLRLRLGENTPCPPGHAHSRHADALLLLHTQLLPLLKAQPLLILISSMLRWMHASPTTQN
jgi:hypothetical protein